MKRHKSGLAALQLPPLQLPPQLLPQAQDNPH
jgi:hypothetical protein